MKGGPLGAALLTSTPRGKTTSGLAEASFARGAGFGSVLLVGADGLIAGIYDTVISPPSVRRATSPCFWIISVAYAGLNDHWREYR